MKMYMDMDLRFKISKTITLNTILLLLFAAAALPDRSASFGFDSANSCSPNGKLSRRGRAQMLAAIPCDLGKQAFCHLPGSAYPWHAVRRFVHENQGLMKRMYGDVRHISILRDEFQNNEVDVDDVEDAAERYTKDRGRAAKYMLHNRDDFASYKGGNDVLLEPHFRPVSTTSTTTTTTTSTTSTTTTTPTTTTDSNTTETPVLRDLELQPELEKPNLESNSIYEQPSTDKVLPAETDNIQIIDSPQLGLRNLSSESAAVAAIISATLPAAGTTAKTVLLPPKRNSPTRQRPQRPTATTLNEQEPPPTTTVLLKDSNATTALPASSAGSSTSAPLLRKNLTKSVLTTAATTSATFVSLFSATSATVSQDKLRKPVTNAPNAPTSTPASISTTKTLLREGQLFQDAMKQEPVQVNSNLRGVNACPVKDEVVAPFWANNTRGEVLALLNLYPFEQYVHWEKCTQEFKQMFCRDGCRCEQQYRLHRLLAYDPHNECRGIFSDWFRFPSSCICKCYNIPMDFRATSRSPRSESSFETPPAQPHPIELAEAEVQRAIYEHATEQWYRPRDDLDLYEG